MKRPALAVLIGAGKPHGEEEEDEGYDSGGEKKDAARQVLRAIKDGDPEDLASAICALVDLHMSDEDEEESDEEEERGEDEDEDY